MTLFFAATTPLTIPIATILSRLGIGFTKHTSNPVLPKGASGEWDDWGVRDMAIVIDEHGLLYRQLGDGIEALYWGRPSSTGTIQIGRVTSTNSGITWFRDATNPVIEPSGVVGSWYRYGVGTGAAIREAGVYSMIATGYDAAGTATTIGVFASLDGVSWSDQGQKLTIANFLDGATAMVEGGVMSVIKRSTGDYLALFEYKSSVANTWRIFGATATAFTGTWTTLNAGQPLFTVTGAGWEAVGVANPRIIENTAGHYVMAYNGIGSGADNYWRIGFAYGTTLTALTRYASNPVLTKGTAGQWDDLQVEACFLCKEPTTGTLRLFYQGFDDADGSMQVGLATA